MAGAYFYLAFKAVRDRNQGELKFEGDWSWGPWAAHGVIREGTGRRASRVPGSLVPRHSPWGKPDLGTDQGLPLLGLARIDSRSPKSSSQTPRVTREATCPLKQAAQKVPTSRARLGLASLGRKATELLSDRQPCAVWKQKAGVQGPNHLPQPAPAASSEEA